MSDLMQAAERLRKWKASGKKYTADNPYWSPDPRPGHMGYLNAPQRYADMESVVVGMLPLLDPTPADAEWMLKRPGSRKCFGRVVVEITPDYQIDCRDGQDWNLNCRPIWPGQTVTRGMFAMLEAALKGGQG